MGLGAAVDGAQAGYHLTPVLSGIVSPSASDAYVPFLVEDELKAKGGLYSKGPDLAPYVVSDGLLITGQNPKSSGLALKFLIDQLAMTAA